MALWFFRLKCIKYHNELCGVIVFLLVLWQSPPPTLTSLHSCCRNAWLSPLIIFVWNMTLKFTLFSNTNLNCMQSAMKTDNCITEKMMTNLDEMFLTMKVFITVWICDSKPMNFFVAFHFYTASLIHLNCSNTNNAKFTCQVIGMIRTWGSQEAIMLDLFTSEIIHCEYVSQVSTIQCICAQTK